MKTKVISSISGKEFNSLFFPVLPRVGEIFTLLKTGKDKDHYVTGKVISVEHVLSVGNPDDLVIIYVDFDNIYDHKIGDDEVELYGRMLAG